MIYQFTKAFIFLIVFSTAPVFAESWYLEKSINGVEFWKHPELKKTRILIQYQLTKNTYLPEFYQSEDFQKKLQSNKRDTLKFFGITEWNFIIDHTLTKKEHVDILFRGDYIDGKGQKTFFLEKHLYAENSVTQILFSSEETDTKKHQKYFKKFLQFKDYQE